MERKVYFILDASNWWGGGGEGHICPKADSPQLATSGARVFIDRRGLHSEIAFISNSHLQIGIDGLTSVILIVLGIVNVQFQGRFVSFL